MNDTSMARDGTEWNGEDKADKADKSEGLKMQRSTVWVHISHISRSPSCLIPSRCPDQAGSSFFDAGVEPPRHCILQGQIRWDTKSLMLL